jgi:hypothetical protein
MNNHHTKFEVPKPMLFSYHSEIILPPMSMWPWPLTPWPKINWGHLLVMNSHHTKFEVPRKLSLGNHLFYGPTDKQTDKCKAIYPHFLEGGIIINKKNNCYR